MDILYQDKRIFVVLKPVGVVSTDEPGGLPGLVRDTLSDKTACVRIVNRLDQVVGGVMVLARSREANRLLSMQVQQRSFGKEYLAVVHGELSDDIGIMEDLLTRSKQDRKTYVTDTPGKETQYARLSYTVLARHGGMSLVKIWLDTGRTHQIRAQFSSRGLPLVGDKKYGAPTQEGMDGIALWSHSIAFDHPQTEERMHFTAPPPGTWPWTVFDAELRM